jgi:RHS repeat-associated protein
VNTLWPLEDNQNTIRDVVNDSGTLEEHVAYAPFGQVDSAQSTNPGSVVLAFGYTGAYTDVVTCDQLHGVRWYNPATQRWITQDPSGLGPDSNPYRDCGNDPTNETDPSGLAGGKGGVAWDAQARKELIARFEKEMSNQGLGQYAFYETAGVKDFLSKLLALVKTGYVFGIHAPAQIDGPGKWDNLARHVFFDEAIPKMYFPLLVHELTHALDNKNGWNIGEVFANTRAAEQLAYSAQHLFSRLDGLETFDKNVKNGTNGPYKSAAQVQQGWDDAWLQLRTFSNTNVYVGYWQTDEGPVKSEMFLELARKTGLSFSYAKLAPVYQALVDKYLPNLHVILTKPQGLPTAFD